VLFFLKPSEKSLEAAKQGIADVSNPSRMVYQTGEWIQRPFPGFSYAREEIPLPAAPHDIGTFALYRFKAFWSLK